MNQDTYKDTKTQSLLARLRPQAKDKTPSIIKTLLDNHKRGLEESSLKSISYSLKQLAKLTDLDNPEAVKLVIANMKVSNATKTKHANNYDYYCKANGLEWTPPRYKWERPIPIIPTTANIDKIISASTPKFATIFTILKETGLECHELVTMTRNDIDSERGIITARGCKGHNSRSFKLKEKTAEMLRCYLARYTDKKPFPNSKAVSEIWRRTRNKLAKTLNEPDLKTIPLRNLRHYYACILYDKTKDILLVKQRLGHKKIETTMFYTQLIHFNDEEEYTVRVAQTIEEDQELIEAGFQYVTERDGHKLFRKRK